MMEQLVALHNCIIVDNGVKSIPGQENEPLWPRFLKGERAT
jgi:hypothetical protein